MFRIRSAATLGAVALLGVTVLAGCSSDSESTSTETTSEENTQMLPPVIIEVGQTEATAKVGDNLDIIVEDIAGTTVSTDNPEVVELTQAKEEGGALFNPGGKALAPGTAVITLTLPDMTESTITLTVTE
ncbi:MAG: hypothetical protein NWR45_09160 [Candidatus Nanopelagicales bacterium]|nr:hypothetical protein [Candidatus Nanopelagicales bacterium]